MAGISDLLKTLVYGAAIWKKVGDPAYRVAKKVYKNEKELRDSGIDVSLLNDIEYIDSLSQEKKEAVERYYRLNGYLQNETSEIQERFQEYSNQTYDMEIAKQQLEDCNIDPKRVEDKNYFSSLTLEQKSIAKTYMQMRVLYLNDGNYKNFSEASGRFNNTYRKIIENRCPKCNGTGWILCPKCQGTGIDAGVGICLYCDGDKEVKCDRCGGSGKIEQDDDF